MSTTRDGHGIPTITGTTLVEVARLQGQACAADRAWQLELERSRALGQMARLLGPCGITWDAFARRAEIAQTAQHAYASLDRESQAFVDAYVEGVNAELATAPQPPELAELGARAQAWEPWTPLAVFWVAHILFGSLPAQLWRHHVREVAGAQVLDLLNVEGAQGGSNAFVLGGERTASGMPIIAGDPHRLFEDPNVYSQVRLRCTSPTDPFDVIGLAFPGVPGIPHFGHTGEVAWAITNAVADSHDITVESAEELARTQVRTELIEVRDAAPLEVTCRRTSHGPVVIEPDESGVGPAISLRTPPEVLGDLGFAALPLLLRARTVADVEAAWSRWVDPVNNVLAADRAGRAVHFVAGRVPTRGGGAGQVEGERADSGESTEPGESESQGQGAADAWTGWVNPLPHREVAPDQFAVTANQRAWPAFDTIGSHFAAPFRAERMATRIEQIDQHTPASAAAILLDEHQSAGATLLNLIAALDGLPPQAQAAQARLAQWDREMAATSTEAALFVRTREEIVTRLCAAPDLAPLARPCPYGELYAPWFSLASRLTQALPTVLKHARPGGLERDALLREALIAAASSEPEQGQSWGSRHRFHALSGQAQFGLPGPVGPATELGGDGDCVRMTLTPPGSQVTVLGSVARYVFSLANRDESAWVVPLGASGLPTSPHYRDQHQAWAHGRLIPIPTDSSEATDGRERTHPRSTA